MLWPQPELALGGLSAWMNRGPTKSYHRVSSLIVMSCTRYRSWTPQLAEYNHIAKDRRRWRYVVKEKIISEMDHDPQLDMRFSTRGRGNDNEFVWILL